MWSAFPPLEQKAAHMVEGAVIFGVNNEYPAKAVERFAVISLASEEACEIKMVEGSSGESSIKWRNLTYFLPSF
jgi:hypothetical protein